jgi:hypothetical protein
MLSNRSQGQNLIQRTLRNVSTTGKQRLEVVVEQKAEAGCQPQMMIKASSSLTLMMELDTAAP